MKARAITVYYAGQLQYSTTQHTTCKAAKGAFIARNYGQVRPEQVTAKFSN